jgi:hypothetical protein
MGKSLSEAITKNEWKGQPNGAQAHSGEKSWATKAVVAVCTGTPLQQACVHLFLADFPSAVASARLARAQNMKQCVQVEDVFAFRVDPQRCECA